MALSDALALRSLGASAGWQRDGWDVLDRVLELALDHLGMEIAWVSQFTDGDQVLRSVAGDDASFGVEPGFRASLAGSFCTRVVDGRLPNIVSDARADERTRDLAVTEALGIGSYIGAPLRFSSGQVYGMLCCLSHRADHLLGPSEVRFLELMAHVVAEQIERHEDDLNRRQDQEARVRAAIVGDGLSMVFQPIVSLASMEVVGAEALSRFAAGPTRPDAWFAEAASLGLGIELEMAAIRIALADLERLPDGVYLAVNASPAAVTAPELADLIGEQGPRLVVEITEHAAVEDYDVLRQCLEPLRDAGVRLAVDDAGAGFASLRHILQLGPDIIKMDIDVTRGVHADPARAALARSLTSFATDIGAVVVVEGVETLAELRALEEIGVFAAQGYFLGRPTTLPLHRHG